MLGRAEVLSLINGYIERYTPVCLDIVGRWVGGDEKVYLALKDLLRDVQRMPDLADDGR